MRTGRRLLLLLLLVLLILWPQRVRACTPPVGGLPEYDMADYAAAAAVVFRGTVQDVAPGAVWESASIRVTRYLKGTGDGSVVVDGFGLGSVCRVSVFPDDDLIFFATPVAGDSGRFTAFYLSQFDAVAAATPANIAALEAALGLDPVTPQPPAPPADDPAPVFAGEPGAPIALALLFVLGCVVLLFLFASSAAAFVQLRRRR
jgi:hypothetical protein